LLEGADEQPAATRLATRSDVTLARRAQ
jgi:hypothetical protein